MDGGAAIVIHERSRMTVGPRVPTTLYGTRRVFTDQADIACTKREDP